MFKLAVVIGLGIVSQCCGSLFRSPTPLELDSYIRAEPIFPIVRNPFFPGFSTPPRADFGVGLPGGRSKPYSGCSENRTLELWDFGTILTPKYPEDYPPSTTCEWLLQSPEGTKIEATVYDIDTQPWFLNYFDSVSISNDGGFRKVDNYAGDQNDRTPFTVSSASNKFGVRFQSNSILNYRGLKLQYVVKPLNETATPYDSPDDGVCGTTFILNPDLAPAAPETTTEGQVEATTDNSTRIIGNTPAPKHGYPWMVALLIDGQSFCGGSIIDETHILTAAHCTNGAKQITILIGAHNLKAPKSEEPERRVVNITSESIFQHPKYNEDTVFNDISILRLPEKLTFDSNVRPICLPNRKYLSQFFEEQKVGVSGWGIVADQGKISPVLQETDVVVMNNGQCRQIFRDILTGNQICVKTTPQNSPCRGDSGGPLFIKQTGSNGDYFMQVGIVSFGTFTCERGYPVAFTRITAFMDYINLITGKKLW